MFTIKYYSEYTNTLIHKMLVIKTQNSPIEQLKLSFELTLLINITRGRTDTVWKQTE